MNNNPLMEAMKAKQQSSPMSAEELLSFILTRYKLVPIDTDSQEEEQEEPQEVVTQESHRP